ncbi:carboxypeptidase regulatory-like domain-containing protein [Sesbania bispinosa]|nr:carboxypeptidase regulatory-like domain-containing protein [Sesbania bispinosa]
MKKRKQGITFNDEVVKCRTQNEEIKYVTLTGCLHRQIQQMSFNCSFNSNFRSNLQVQINCITMDILRGKMGNKETCAIS